MSKVESIAHVRKVSSVHNSYQKICDHLSNVSNISKVFAEKIGLGKAGELLGLLHDLGKYSFAFQNYIGSATGLINQDEDEYVDSQGLKGKIDHSTAGAQYIWNLAKDKRLQEQIAVQLLALCVASHHSGLIDCLNVDGENNFDIRMAKSDNKTHLEETLKKVESEIIGKVKSLIDDPECYGGVLKVLKKIAQSENKETLIRFQAGLLK